METLVKHVFIFLIVLFLLSGCNGFGIFDNPADDGDDKDNDPGVQVFFDDALGRGYDILGNYADNKEVRAQVLDFEALQLSENIDVRDVERATIESFSGSSIEEYTENMEASVEISGSYKGFSGSLSTNFSTSSYSKSAYSYSTLQSRIYKRELSVDITSTNEMREYLTEKASNDLNNPSITPKEILDRFGSHVLVGIFLGGRLDYNVATNMTTFESTTSIGVAAEASFKNAFASAEVEAKFKNENEFKSFQSSSEIRLNVYGGSSELGQNIIDDSDYRTWIDSVPDRQIFVGFADGRPLIAIWDLIEDSSRAEAIKQEFEKIAGDISDNFITQPVYVKVTLKSFKTPDQDLDDETGSGDMDLYGSVTAIGWENISNYSGKKDSHSLFSRSNNNKLILRKLDTYNIDKTVEIALYNFDENKSGIELKIDFIERDPGPSGDDKLYKTRNLKLSDGFTKEHTVTVTHQNRTDKEKIDVIFDLSLVR